MHCWLDTPAGTLLVTPAQACGGEVAWGGAGVGHEAEACMHGRQSGIGMRAALRLWGERVRRAGFLRAFQVLSSPHVRAFI